MGWQDDFHAVANIVGNTGDLQGGQCAHRRFDTLSVKGYAARPVIRHTDQARRGALSAM